MRPINRIPKGFLGFFGLKSLGKNPEVLLDEVRPTVDLREWYLETNVDQVRDVHTITAAAYAGSDPFTQFTGALSQVPPDEWWWVRACTMVVFAQTGAVWQQPGIMTVRNSAPSQFYEALLSTTMAEVSGPAPIGGPLSSCYHSRPRCWLPPNTLIGASWGYVTTGTMTPGDVININAHLTIARVPA